MSFATLGIALLAPLFTAHCDAYECTPVACSDSGSWGRCIACYGDSCTYEARNADGDAVDSCDYDTSDASARDACFDQTNAAGAATCGDGDPGGGTGDCGHLSGCSACTKGGCAFCESTGECQDYGTGDTCAKPTIDLPGDCEAPPPSGCAKYEGCSACTTAGCAYCAAKDECQDYGSGATCSPPTIDLPGDCHG